MVPSESDQFDAIVVDIGDCLSGAGDGDRWLIPLGRNHGNDHGIARRFSLIVGDSQDHVVDADRQGSGNRGGAPEQRRTVTPFVGDDAAVRIRGCRAVEGEGFSAIAAGVVGGLVGACVGDRGGVSDQRSDLDGVDDEHAGTHIRFEFEHDVRCGGGHPGGADRAMRDAAAVEMVDIVIEALVLGSECVDGREWTPVDAHIDEQLVAHPELAGPAPETQLHSCAACGHHDGAAHRGSRGADLCVGRFGETVGIVEEGDIPDDHPVAQARIEALDGDER